MVGKQITLAVKDIPYNEAQGNGPANDSISCPINCPITCPTIIPPIKPPPWMNTNTGSDAAASGSGVCIDRRRQSSDMS